MESSGDRRASETHPEKRRVLFSKNNVQTKRYSNYHPSPQECEPSVDVKAGDVGSSDESIVCDVCPDETGDISHRYQDFIPEETDQIQPKPKQNVTCRFAKRSTSFDNTVPTSPNPRCFQECDGINVPQAAMAMYKLRKLKDLQWRRDLTERYYSQEIRRLIGDQFFNSKMNSLDNLGKNGPIYPQEQVLPMVKNLEPYGTVTTITRLECGCMEEVTKPIFTPATGGKRHQRNCQHEQLNLNLAPPNSRIFVHSPTRTRNKLPSSKYYSTMAGETRLRDPSPN